MTDAAYKTEFWLMRTDELTELREKQINTVAMIETRINNCVSSYEHNGSAHDPIRARAAHEDLIADYATAQNKLEQITARLNYENNINQNIISRLPNSLYRSVLNARFVKNQSMDAIIIKNRKRIDKGVIYRLYNEALESLAELLEKQPENIPIEPDKKAELTIIDTALA